MGNADCDMSCMKCVSCHNITPHGEIVKEYEFKNGDLRVYAIKDFNGKIIILGGYKNTQQTDINRFRSLKAQYLANKKK